MTDLRVYPGQEDWSDLHIRLWDVVEIEVACVNMLSDAYYLTLKLHRIPTRAELREMKAVWEEKTRGLHFTVYVNTPVGKRFAEFFGFRETCKFPDYIIMERQG